MATEKHIVGLSPVTLRTEHVVNSIMPIEPFKSRFVPLGLFTRDKRLLQKPALPTKQVSPVSNENSFVGPLGKSLRRRVIETVRSFSDMLPGAHIGRRRLNPQFA